MTTREQWLLAGVERLRPVFEGAGFPLPPAVRVSVGWPRATRRAIGQCWKRLAAVDNVGQIFISPSVADPVAALDVLAHELVHAAIDPHSGHTGKFVKAMHAVGLEGKPTHAGAGPVLKAQLAQIAAGLGPYPHAQLNAVDLPKQSTRLLKVSCTHCGYTCRVTRVWLEYGTPVCPVHLVPMELR